MNRTWTQFSRLRCRAQTESTRKSLHQQKRPWTTTLKKNLLTSLFSLLFSCLLLFRLLFSQCLSLSVSVSVWCGGRGLWCVMLCCVVLCVVVCDTLKTPCMPAPRAHVFSTCARGAGIHGDLLNVYQVEVEGERVGGVVVSLVFFIGKNQWFFFLGKFHEHLNRTLGSSLIDSSAHQKLST